MARNWLKVATVSALFISVTPVALAQSNSVHDSSFFAEKLYPVMKAAQCSLCHSDNGVGSATRLRFPDAQADAEQIATFGINLVSLVDRQNPAGSLLLLKPTKQVEHTGGKLIAPGSEDEQVLLAWIKYLAALPEEEIKLAKAKSALAVLRSGDTLRMRRLTHSQYNNTVRDLVGDLSRPADNFPKEDFIGGFKNQSEAQGVPPLQAEAYSEAAERLSRSAFRGGDQQGLIPCKPSSASDSACTSQFIRQFGLKAFRRPIADEESRLYEGLFESEARRTGDFLGGARLVVEAMLQSPHFLFRIERGPGSRFRQYEIASSLSYFLWDTMPSGELLQAAEQGKFASTEQVKEAARRMLQDPRSKASMAEFLAQWLRFDRVLTAIRERRLFREFSTELAVAMTEETRQLFDHLVWEGKDFREFLTADYTFVSTDLARLYGLPQPSEEFAKVVYPPDSGRGGVLGHGSVLTLTSHPADTSPTARGLFVREHFLCHRVPPPPAGVNTTLPLVTENKPLTNRDRLGVHLNSEACAGCHVLIDPIGLGFEQYDAIGRYREQLLLRFRRSSEEESGERNREPLQIKLDLDTKAHIQGVKNSEFTAPKQLGQILARDEGCQRCMVKQLFRYALSREETPADQEAIETMLRQFQSSGFRFQELIVSMVASKPFLGGGSD